MSDREIWSLSHVQCAAILSALRSERDRIERICERPGAQPSYSDRQRDLILKQVLGLYGSKSYEKH